MSAYNKSDYFEEYLFQKSSTQIHNNTMLQHKLNIILKANRIKYYNDKMSYFPKRRYFPYSKTFCNLKIWETSYSEIIKVLTNQFASQRSVIT